ncbi:hypothetical protein, variant [Aphanomyces astaci]|uniref:FYVE-type domain-containing protein n=1 Tax=Aphanomyces astaci TaxID=112090 RepID=W4GMA0_APHAT|nr:hypothetical protein, variant [Aphanomyces astaci]ETV80139.1 hypothetical protein, variant [Aphanomyces astaci]|eukprot:XP_009830063.1 hypothetical protein, variant [Aphanomyces astaci]
MSSSFRDNGEARAMGREDLSGYQLKNGLYVDPNESDEDADSHVGSFHHDGSGSIPPRKMSRSMSSPNIGPKSAVPPTIAHPIPPLKLDDHSITDASSATSTTLGTLKTLPTSPMNTLPDAIMAAFGKFSPSTVPLSPTTERKTSSPVCIGDPNGAAPPPHSVYINPPLAPPPFASLTICENCKVEVGTLLSKPRHHCRNCGGTYCQACSTKSSVIPYDALMAKGEFRVCDCCFLKIREFQSQTGTTQCSWNGLSPMSEASFLAKFAFPASQAPVVVVSCCYFPECVPYYGHMYLTREHVCFYAYKATLEPICISYEDVTAVVKPEFYFINALQLKATDKSWFFAEFNGQRDMSYGRLDQLLSAHRQQYKESDHTPELLKEMASQRRQSYLNSNQRKISIVREDEDFVPLPPDETLSKMTKILDTELQSDVQHLYETLFHTQEFYHRVMVSTKDIDISIGDWQPIAQCPVNAMSSLCVSKDPMSHFRKVESKHPPKVTFPGLPPYAECTRYQLCRHDENTIGGTWTRFVLAETLRMKKIPYADYFEIETRWVFTLDGNKFCHAEVCW